MAIPKRLRFEILRRDGHRCVYCGATAAEAKLAVDHVKADKLGGATVPENLVTACVDCNSGKASTTVDAAFIAQVEENAAAWLSAMRAAAEIRKRQQGVFDAQVMALDDEWTRWTFTADGEERQIPRPENWDITAEGFLARGLPIAEMLHFVPIAMRASIAQTRIEYPRWRYFIGCCKRALGEQEKIARELIAARGMAAMPVREEEPDRPPTLSDLP